MRTSGITDTERTPNHDQWSIRQIQMPLPSHHPRQNHPHHRHSHHCRSRLPYHPLHRQAKAPQAYLHPHPELLPRQFPCLLLFEVVAVGDSSRPAAGILHTHRGDIRIPAGEAFAGVVRHNIHRLVEEMMRTVVEVVNYFQSVCPSACSESRLCFVFAPAWGSVRTARNHKHHQSNRHSSPTQRLGSLRVRPLRPGAERQAERHRQSCPGWRNVGHSPGCMGCSTPCPSSCHPHWRQLLGWPGQLDCTMAVVHWKMGAQRVLEGGPIETFQWQDQQRT